MSERIRILIVDDSPFVCKLLQTMLEAVPDFEVVGVAQDGLKAIHLCAELRPDVVTLDLEMPRLGGLAVLARMMSERPVPVVMLSGVSQEAALATLRALELGAIDFIFKYVPGVDTDPSALEKELESKIRAAAKVRVIRTVKQAQFQPTPPLTPVKISREHLHVVVIGASTGGPVALRELLSELPAEFPWPIVVVQHMPPNFTPALANMLDRQVPLQVREARNGDRLRAGQVLIAPGDHHLTLSLGQQVWLNQEAKIGGHRPSIDITMFSAAHVYESQAIGVLMTGMGRDGSDGLASIYAKGGLACVQSLESCVIDSMPHHALDKGVVHHAGTPVELARILGEACGIFLKRSSS